MKVYGKSPLLGLMILAGIFIVPISGIVGDDASIKGELRSDI